MILQALMTYIDGNEWHFRTTPVLLDHKTSQAFVPGLFSQNGTLYDCMWYTVHKMAECVFQRGRNVHGMDGDGFLVGHIVTTDKMKLCWSGQN